MSGGHAEDWRPLEEGPEEEQLRELRELRERLEELERLFEALESLCRAGRLACANLSQLVPEVEASYATNENKEQT